MRKSVKIGRNDPCIVVVGKNIIMIGKFKPVFNY